VLAPEPGLSERGVLVRADPGSSSMSKGIMSTLPSCERSSRVSRTSVRDSRGTALRRESDPVIHAVSLSKPINKADCMQTDNIPSLPDGSKSDLTRRGAAATMT
jgi:hypothetical protein